MSRLPVLHQITVVDTAPENLAELAAANACQEISLFTFSPRRGLPQENSGYSFPLVTQQNKQSVLNSLKDNNVSVNGVEFFPIAADIEVNELKPALALGRELGAQRAVTLIFDDDQSRAIDKLGAFTELACAEGLVIGLEFTPLTRGCRSLAQAVQFVEQVGNSQLGIGIDTLHFVRSGGSVAELKALDPKLFRYAQLCDGHGLHNSSDYYTEAHNREFAGKGDFPLVDIIAALPADIPVEVEVPSEVRLQAGVTAAQHAKEAITCAKSLLQAAALV